MKSTVSAINDFPFGLLPDDALAFSIVVVIVTAFAVIGMAIGWFEVWDWQRTQLRRETDFITREAIQHAKRLP